jgi:hypothetical protein
VPDFSFSFEEWLADQLIARFSIFKLNNNYPILNPMLDPQKLNIQFIFLIV